jgi:uncharacterized membrane protein
VVRIEPGSRRVSRRSVPVWRTASSRVRLGLVVLAGAAVAVLVGLLGRWPVAPLIGWDVAAVLFSVWAWAIMISSDPAATAAHATRADPGRAQSDAIILSAAVASLAAVAFVLVRAGSAKGNVRDELIGLAVGSVAASWFLVHTLFSLRYARLYYTGPDGGIDFNQRYPPPRYLDFAYVAFTIGMTFQVSDTDIEAPGIRATALRQALIGYLFGAVILAATINLLAALATAG